MTGTGGVIELSTPPLTETVVAAVLATRRDATELDTKTNVVVDDS